jgi:ATP-dependent helicase HrpA
MVQVPEIPPHERYPGRPGGGRLVVIAPTRAACETIEMGVGLTEVETIIEREHGQELRELARSGKGFGIVAGTGTGKTLAIRPIAEELVGTPLRTGVVNREREATPETPTWNVVIVTTGIARRWFQDDLIGAEDTIVVDEIHQTSAELELCLALGKRAGCRFIWLSATVDPSFYMEYLESAGIIESSAFDPSRAATVRVSNTMNPIAFLAERFMRHVMKERRGVGVFVPTRAGTEEVARHVEERWPRAFTTYYHGGEPIAKLRPFLEGDAPHPFVLSMTSAGQSALNIRGLDTVIIEDAQFTSLVRRGKGVLTRLPLGPNEILQMAGRVHGRVEGGEVWILSEREIDFESLEPVAPNFQLAGDPERVAMTCADMGVRADDLELPVPLDAIAYRRAVRNLEERGLISGNRLTEYGRKVEVLPVDRPWGELLVHADEELIPMVAACASIDSLHRMTRQERFIDPWVVEGSDHLTVYSLYREALERAGRMGQVYGLPRHVFDEEALAEWSEESGVLGRSVEDGALAMASIYRALDLPLPETLPPLSRELDAEWRRLIARVMPFDMVIDGETSWEEQVSTSMTSVCSNHGAVAGDLRYFADRFGKTRGSIEGTEIPHELIWEYAGEAQAEVVFEGRFGNRPLRLRRQRVYHGFVLESEEEPLDRFPPELADEARRVLAEALATGEARHPRSGSLRETLKELREVHRRSGGAAAGAAPEAIAAALARELEGVGSFADFLEAEISLDPDAVVPRSERERWLALPPEVQIGGFTYPLDYHFEGDESVVRIRIPERDLDRVEEEDVPELDRPVRWTVLRGKQDSVRADTLEEARRQIARERAPRRGGGPKGRGGGGPRGRDGGGGKGGGGKGGRGGKGGGGKGRRSGQKKAGKRGGRGR